MASDSGNQGVDKEAGPGVKGRCSHSCRQLEHWWFSGRILACHAGGPGSIPGQCSSLNLFDSFPKPSSNSSLLRRILVLNQDTFRQLGSRFYCLVNSTSADAELIL